MRRQLSLFILIVFITLSVIYYNFLIAAFEGFGVSLSISTFLFSVFAGFFIARQGTRYSVIRDHISIFDGEISVIYRFAMHLPKDIRDEIKSIIQKEYKKIMKKGEWEIVFIEKTTLITDIHKAIDKLGKKKNFNQIQAAAINRIFVATHALQKERKHLLAARIERIPFVQWVLIYSLAIILLVLLTTIPSGESIWLAILKGSYGTIVIIVLMMLHQFDSLKFFEKEIGEISAQDVLDIIAGKK